MVYISSNTRILTITDDRLFYLRVHYAFTQEPGIEIMLSSNTTLRGLKKIKQLEPDIILIDGDLPDNDAISVCSNILQNGYSGHIILFEMDFKRARNACEIGVTTCFPRDIGYRELLSSTRLIRQRKQASIDTCQNRHSIDNVKKDSVINMNTLGRLYLNQIEANMQTENGLKNQKKNRYNFYNHATMAILKHPFICLSRIIRDNL